MKKFWSLILFLSIIAFPVQGKEVPTSGEMMSDLFLGRPLGIASIALGSSIFILSLPFTAATGSVANSARRLVVYPAKWTFYRGLGDFPGYLDEPELVSE